MKLRDAVLVGLDFETTGFDPDAGDRIVEVGVAHMYAGEVFRAISQVVDPGRPIPQEVVAIHGIDDERVRTAPTIEQQASVIESWFRPRDLGVSGLAERERLVLVAFNWPFERRFLLAELPGLLAQLDGIPVLDPQILAYTDSVTRWWHGRSRRSLVGLTKWLGLRHERPHSAREDAMAALEVLWELRTHMPEDVHEAAAYLEGLRPEVEERVRRDREREAAEREAAERAQAEATAP